MTGARGQSPAALLGSLVQDTGSRGHGDVSPGRAACCFLARHLSHASDSHLEIVGPLASSSVFQGISTKSGDGCFVMAVPFLEHSLPKCCAESFMVRDSQVSLVQMGKLTALRVSDSTQGHHPDATLGHLEPGNLLLALWELHCSLQGSSANLGRDSQCSGQLSGRFEQPCLRSSLCLLGVSFRVLSVLQWLRGPVLG